MRLRPLFRHLSTRLRHDGLAWLGAAALDRLFPARPGLAPAVLAATQGRTGLEIGGPSRVFSRHGILPVYTRVARLDNTNFAANTAWEGGLRDGGEFRFDRSRPPGRQFLREATRLTCLADATYDFVLSSHCLEHCANPLAALQEWRRLVRPGGHLVLVLPDPVRSFDHARPITTLAHLRDDLAGGTGEDDRTHLEEILTHHDLRLDPHAGTPAEFRARALQNAENRCLHHHVFDLPLLRAVLLETGWTVEGVETVRPIHLVALARNTLGSRSSAAPA